jgi:hypothetical protein
MVKHSRKRRSKLKILALLLGIIALIAVLSRKRQPVSPALGTKAAPLTGLFNKATMMLNQLVQWHQLPFPLSLLNLIAMRNVLRERNLYDTTPATPKPWPTSDIEDKHYLIARQVDGTFNDLNYPDMGSAGARFGRNVPLNFAYPDEAALLSPNPRTVSRELLTRHQFQPATSLNLLAAAWVQFMVHDWFSHGKNEKDDPLEIPLESDDPWPENPMRVQRTRRDPTRTPDEQLPPTYVNVETHWWDGSQIYGSTREVLAAVRSGQDGKLAIGDDGLLPVDPRTGIEVTGVSGNWWIGLALLHTLFTLEHNAICDRLGAEFPHWSDDDLFDRARLINAALMAKIHTIEWTPGILNQPTLQVAMDGNWWGLAGEQLAQRFGRISSSEVISGIPGSPTDHHGALYALTEEFVAVYRMHPLIPDGFTFRSLIDNELIETRSFPEVAGRHARERLNEISMADLIYSFGMMHPGAITLHNYPRALQQFTKQNSDRIVDVASIDILRDRERGVPRYNEFRKLLHMPPVNSFEELTENPEWAEEIRQVYHNDIDQVDLMIGLFAETPPPGFGFSDTAFRIFILMASRRLKSDRFFTTYYTPAVYTQTGMDWITDNRMSTVLSRHFPQLRPALTGVDNPFAPWRTENS